MATTLNTPISYAFRAAVALNVAFLFVLTFVLRDTIVGRPHLIVAVCLSILMVMEVVLFIIDMSTPAVAARKHAKLIDFWIGCIWFISLGFLFMNSLHNREIPLR
jgi:hypothetical protein